MAYRNIKMAGIISVAAAALRHRRRRKSAAGIMAYQQCGSSSGGMARWRSMAWQRNKGVARAQQRKAGVRNARRNEHGSGSISGISGMAQL